jgi:hypothetical protein
MASPTAAATRLSRYLVEVPAPTGGWERLQAATARARASAAELRGDGQQVRFIRSVAVPEDGRCYFLYEAPNLAAVRTALTRAGIQQVAIRRTVAAGRTHA